MRKLICLLAGHRWKENLFTVSCLRCGKQDISDATMAQFGIGQRNVKFLTVPTDLNGGDRLPPHQPGDFL